jgi:hypothetical protein
MRPLPRAARIERRTQLGLEQRLIGAREDLVQFVNDGGGTSEIENERANLEIRRRTRDEAREVPLDGGKR